MRGHFNDSPHAEDHYCQSGRVRFGGVEVYVHNGTVDDRPGVVVSDYDQLRALTDGEAHELGMHLVRTADRLRRERNGAPDE